MEIYKRMIKEEEKNNKIKIIREKKENDKKREKGE